MKRIGAVGITGLVLTFGVAHFSHAAGPVAPKPNVPGAAAAPTAIGSMTASAAAPVFFKPSPGGKDTTQYAQQAQATARCTEESYTLHYSLNDKGLPTAQCDRQSTMPETMKPGCPGGWGYLVTDDKFVPNVKQHFGNVDQCFRNNDSGNKKEDIANYKPANCAITANGGTGGFVLKVKNGADVCERDVPAFEFQSPGLPNSTVKIRSPKPDDVKDLIVSCPPLSYMWVDVPYQNRKYRIVDAGGQRGTAGMFCQKG